MTAKTILALAQAHRREPSKVNYDALADAVRLVCTALEAAQKDAERYRWLKDNRSYHYSMQPDSPAEHGIEYQWQQGTYEERHQGLDGSIDAAIKAQGDANE